MAQRYASTVSTRSEIAGRMRRHAGEAERDHPGMQVHGHLRDAAKQLERGNTEGAQRHLRAAMQSLTPLQLVRHGHLDDQEHQAGKEHMAHLTRHLLQIKDVADTDAQNEHYRAARAAMNAPAGNGIGRPDGTANGPTAPVSTGSPAPPARNWIKSGQQSAGPSLIGGAKHLSNIDLSLAWLHEARGKEGEWTGAGSATEAAASGAGFPLEEVRRVHGDEAAGHLSAARRSSGDEAIRHLHAADSIIADHLRNMPSGALKARHQGLLNEVRLAARRIGAGFDAGSATESITMSNIDLVGPKGYIHGWIYVGGPAGKMPLTGDQLPEAAHSLVSTHFTSSPEATRYGVNVIPRGDKNFPSYYSQTAMGPAPKGEHWHVTQAGVVTHRNAPPSSQPKALQTPAPPLDVNRGAAGFKGDVGTSSLPADIKRALGGYEAAKTSGSVRFSGGSKFATRYPGHARTERQLKTFYGSKMPAFSNDDEAEVYRTALELTEDPAFMRVIELSAQTARLASTPRPYGKPGGPGLYNVKGLKHSDYLENIVHALMTKRGMDKGQATAVARAAIRKWLRGGGHVHPEVRAAAASAEAEELRAQARAHSHSNASQGGIELARKAYYVHPGETVQCPYCHKMNEDDAKFCDQCGRELPESAFNLSNEILLFNPNHGPTGQFTTAQNAQQKKGKKPPQQRPHVTGHAGSATSRARQKGQLLMQARKDFARAAQLRAQLHALLASMRAGVGSRSGATKGSSGATKGAGGATKGAASATKGAASKAGSTSRSAASTSRASMQAKAAQLRSQISSLMAAGRAAQAQAAKL